MRCLPDMKQEHTNDVQHASNGGSWKDHLDLDPPKCLFIFHALASLLAGPQVQATRHTKGLQSRWCSVTWLQHNSNAGRRADRRRQVSSDNRTQLFLKRPTAQTATCRRAH